MRVPLAGAPLNNNLKQSKAAHLLSQGNPRESKSQVCSIVVLATLVMPCHGLLTRTCSVEYGSCEAQYVDGLDGLFLFLVVARGGPVQGKEDDGHKEKGGEHDDDLDCAAD
jgi:hypothetical protein